MRTRKLGSLEVSVVGLGCNNFGGRIDESRSASVVHAALDAGVTLFDTADVYGTGLSEEYLGKSLGSSRDEVIIATKVGHQMGTDPAHKGGSPRWIKRAVEDSLRRLGTDRIDLYQMHVPDPDVPIEDSLTALAELVQEGKVREIGCSNFFGEQIDEAAAVSASRDLSSFVSAQNHYSLLTREVEKEVIPACERHGLGMLPYFPLESGMLTGKYSRDQEPPEGSRLSSVPAERRSKFMSDRAFEAVEKLEALADGWGCTVLDVAIGGLAAERAVASVIAGATKPEQVKGNVKAGSWVPSPEQLEEIRRATPA